MDELVLGIPGSGMMSRLRLGKKQLLSSRMQAH
jgi:hypothetical protein